MSEFISMRAARGRIEAKLLVELGVTIEHPIRLGAHPLIEHLLNHETLPGGSIVLRPVKGCRLCGLLKAHQLICEAMEEDQELQDLQEPHDVQDLQELLQELEDQADFSDDALKRWLRGEDMEP